MNLQSFLELFAQGAIVLLAIIVLRQWALWRDRVSLDILMVFGSLALVVVLTSASRLAAYQTRWLDPIAIAVFLAHPYLLMRVVSHFRPVPATVQRVAASGLALAVAAAFVVEVRSAPLITVAFLFFVWLMGYDARAFHAGAKAAGGVTHWRMLHAAWGALLLAVTFVLAVIASTARSSAGLAAGFVPLSALGAALNYYFAFAPPPWLRRTWQSAELYEFLAERSEAERPVPDHELLGRLSAFVIKAVGAKGSAVALWNERQEHLVVQVSTWGYLEPGRPVPEGRLLKAWWDDRAALVSRFEWVLPGGAPAASMSFPFQAVSRLAESSTSCCPKAPCSCRTTWHCCGCAAAKWPSSSTMRR